MPGLVGAVMRSKSPLRSFRSSITHAGDDGIAQQERGLIRLKLFNTVMSELGPSLLREGILLEPAIVMDFLASRTAEIGSGLTEVLFNGKATHMQAVLDEDQSADIGLVSLIVKVRE
jgi:hypothetical protein